MDNFSLERNGANLILHISEDLDPIQRLRSARLLMF